jgi:hypothetical protein
MILAICPICGSRYHQDEPWKKTCLPCWQKKKRAEKSSSGPYEELQMLRAELLRLRLTAPPSIAPDMLSRLIRLCHPDKHGNSEAANEATAWLLAQRVRA